MSHDVYLMQDGDICEAANHTEGGTYAIGGEDIAHLNITYNYGEVYRLFGFAISDLNGKRARDVVEQMREIVLKCGTRQWHEYWAPTLGNAGHALSILVEWADQNPDAVFKVE